MTKHTPHMKPPTYKQSRTTTEEPPWNGQETTGKPVLLARSLTLNSDEALVYKYMFDPHTGILPHITQSKKKKKKKEKKRYK